MKFSKFISSLPGTILLAALLSAVLCIFLKGPIGYYVGISFAGIVGAPYLKDKTNSLSRKIICIAIITVIGVSAIYFTSAKTSEFIVFFAFWGVIITINLLSTLIKEYKAKKQS